MKLNWGTSIVIAFGLFMIFILQFVLKVQSSNKYDHEMVTEDYYKKEKNINGEYERKSNSNALKNPVQIFDTKQGIIIAFPSDFNHQEINGTISLYRPSNQKLDFSHPIKLTSNNLLIPKDKFVGGLWEITIDWEYQNIKYLNQSTINVE